MIVAFLVRWSWSVLFSRVSKIMVSFWYLQYAGTPRVRWRRVSFRTHACYAIGCNNFVFCGAFPTQFSPPWVIPGTDSVKGEITTGAMGVFKKRRSASIMWGPSFVPVWAFLKAWQRENLPQVLVGWCCDDRRDVLSNVGWTAGEQSVGLVPCTVYY